MTSEPTPRQIRRAAKAARAQKDYQERLEAQRKQESAPPSRADLIRLKTTLERC